jgi:uncharacterized heparinase superfamily protein
MLRLFRHGDGTLTHMNGMGVTAADHLATLLTYDDMRSRPIHHAPHSGYHRLEAGRALVVADVGATPPVHLSAEAGAGCLSFEFSSGPQRIIVNCGLPRSATDDVMLAARSTAAHSTATVEGQSSCHFLARKGFWLERIVAGWLIGRLGPVAITGPRQVASERSDRDQVQNLEATHDGFLTRFGLIHERRWRLTAEGRQLEGEDVFLREGRVADDLRVVIRFHLAPGVRASRAQGGRVVMLILPDREAWQFEAGQIEPQLEDSVFFSATEGPRRCEQIVLTVRPAATPMVRWRFERLNRAPDRVAAEPDRVPEPL